MTTAELLRARATDDEVVSWRREQLRRAGCRRFEAEVLARELKVDLHEAVDRRGRTPGIASWREDPPHAMLRVDRAEVDRLLRKLGALS